MGVIIIMMINTSDTKATNTDNDADIVIQEVIKITNCQAYTYLNNGKAACFV